MSANCEQKTTMQYSSDEISVDSDHQQFDGSRGLKYLPHWPSVNIEFQDLVYTVPDINGKLKTKKRREKNILKRNSLQFQIDCAARN